MAKSCNVVLVVAACFSAVAALLHIGVVLGGPNMVSIFRGWISITFRTGLKMIQKSFR